MYYSLGLERAKDLDMVGLGSSLEDALLVLPDRDLNLPHDLEILLANQVGSDEREDPLIGLDGLAQGWPDSRPLKHRVRVHEVPVKGFFKRLLEFGDRLAGVVKLPEVERDDLSGVPVQPAAQPQQDPLEAAEALVEAVAGVLAVPSLKAVAVEITLAIGILLNCTKTTVRLSLSQF